MAHLIFLLVTITLLVGFFVLVQYENKRGSRFLEEKRRRLDTIVVRTQFIVTHVDFAAFAREEIRRTGNRVGQIIVYLSLRAVRAVERFLTRLVRALRKRDADDSVPHETAREFVKTLSDFKNGLEATHPDISVPESE